MEETANIKETKRKKGFDFSLFSYGRLLEVYLLYALGFGFAWSIGLVSHAAPIFYAETRGSDAISLNFIFYSLFLLSLVPIIIENIRNHFFGSKTTFFLYLGLVVAFVAFGVVTSYFCVKPNLADDVWVNNANFMPFLLIESPIFLALMILFYVFRLKPIWKAMGEKSKNNCTKSSIESFEEVLSFAISQDKNLALSQLIFEKGEQGAIVIYASRGGFKEEVILKNYLAGHPLEASNYSLAQSNFKYSDQEKVLEELNKKFAEQIPS